jgi:hypothetical protein
MAKYWSKNNPTFFRGSHRDISSSIITALFFVLLAFFLLLPIIAKPFVYIFDTAAQSTSLIQQRFGSRNIQLSEGECIVSRIPPLSRYDTIAIHCQDNQSIEKGQKVFVQHNKKTYWLGMIEYVTGNIALVHIISDPSDQPLRASVTSLPEQITIRPIGGGSLYTELPASVEIITGSDVYDTDSGLLIGSISGTSLESSTLMQRVYVRIPISFERLESVSLQNK